MRVTGLSGTDKMETVGFLRADLPPWLDAGLRPGQVTKWGSLF